MIKVIIFSLALIFFIGCEKKYTNVSIDANLTVDENLTQIDNLKENYLKYWEYFSKGQYEKSYNLELPYLNYIKTLDWYKEFQGTRRNDYTLKLLSIKSYPYDNKIALLRTQFKSPLKTFELSDKWVLVGHTWYHYYKQSLLPEPPRAIIKYTTN